MSVPHDRFDTFQVSGFDALSPERYAQVVDMLGHTGLIMQGVPSAEPVRDGRPSAYVGSEVVDFWTLPEEEVAVVTSSSILRTLHKDNPTLKFGSLNNVGKVITHIVKKQMGFEMPSEKLSQYETRRIGDPEKGLFIHQTLSGSSSGLRWGLKPLTFLEQMTLVEETAQETRVPAYTSDMATKLSRYKVLLVDYLGH